jgi:hypothetical protein
VQSLVQVSGAYSTGCSGVAAKLQVLCGLCPTWDAAEIEISKKALEGTIGGALLHIFGFRRMMEKGSAKEGKVEKRKVF